MLILISVIVILAICLFYIRRYYKIPSLDAIKEIVSNSSISSIQIKSKFFKIRTLSYVNRGMGLKPKQTSLPLPKPYTKLTSEMVGTFSFAEQPEDESLIFLGKEIKKNEVVGFITALGIPVEVKSPINGKIIGILAKDHSPIEYGQTIIHIEEP